MNRFWLGIGLLAVFLVLGIWVTIAMDAVHQPISEMLDAAAAQALSGDAEAGMALAQQAHDNWERNWRGTAAVADHAPMDEIDSLFAQLEVYAKVGKTSDFAAYCARLSALVHAVGEAHGLGWWNLL